MANYYREKGKDKVYTKEDGKWRHVNYAEAKEKNIWKDVKEVKAGTLKFVTNTGMSAVRKLAAEKLLNKEKGLSKSVPLGSSGTAKKLKKLEWEKKELEKKYEYKKFEKRKKDNVPPFKEKSKMSAVRKLAAEKLSKKESTTTSSKSPYVKVKTLKDGNVIGYKEDGSWTLIKGRYVKRVTLKDGSVVGYKDDGNWELISKPEKKEEKYINKETKKV